jgi:hypothetical protein
MATSEPPRPQPADFGPSIRSFVDRELTFEPVEHGYELRHEEFLLGSLGEPRHEAVVHASTRDGSWWFSRLRGGGVEVSEAREGAPAIAEYRSNLVSGGSIELPDGVRLRLRPPILGETWRVRRGARELIMEFSKPWKPWRVRMTPAAREVYHVPLLTMLAFDAALVELDRPAGGAAGGDGGAVGF